MTSAKGAFSWTIFNSSTILNRGGIMKIKFQAFLIFLLVFNISLINAQCAFDNYGSTAGECESNCAGIEGCNCSSICANEFANTSSTSNSVANPNAISTNSVPYTSAAITPRSPSSPLPNAAATPGTPGSPTGTSSANSGTAGTAPSAIYPPGELPP